MSIYIEPKDLQSTYNEAERVAVEWYKPFDEYERIAGNKLSKTLAKNMPRVNDGSLAASLIETPMNVLPFMQPGKFTSTLQKKSWVGELANIIWKTKIVPNANTQASFFDKEQIALYRATKYGAQPRYNFYVSTENYTGSDWSLPYIKNVKLEPGKFSDGDCDYIFLDIYYTKLQLQKIIDQQKSEVKLAKQEGRKPDTSWNIKALQTLVDGAMDSKQLSEQNINERDKQIHSSGIKTTTCFNRGVNAPFYMFSKHLPEGELLREWKNPDPTGDLPITMQYCYETLESPYGIGRVELAGPTQNVLDYMTQAHVLATQLGLQPPKQVTGPVETANLNTFIQQPDALWIAGNARVEVMNNTNPVYTQFPNNFGLYKSQLQTLQGRTDGSVSASSGNTSFSKTSAGVNMQEQRTNSQDNYLRNKADTASSKMAEKMMNIHMAMMSGADLLDIAEEDRSRLESAGYFDENPQTDEPSINEIPIVYEELRDTFKFKYDPRPEADNEEKNRWLELIDIVASNPNILPMLQASGYEFNVGEAFKRVTSASGATGVDKVLVKQEAENMTENGQENSIEKPGQPQQQPAPQDPRMMMAEQKMQQSQEKHAVDMASKLGKLESQGIQPQQPQQPVQPEIDLKTTMEMYGVDENMATAIMDARSKGFKEEEIMNFLNGGNQ